jgi:RES domain-containing protein
MSARRNGRERREKTTHRLNRTLSLVLLKVREAHDLTANEVLLEVGAEERAKTGQNKDRRGEREEETNWITPAAAGALVPSRMVHARTSWGPQVK